MLYDRFPKEVLNNSIVDLPRLDKIVTFLHMTKDLPGENAEVGVYKGGTSYLIASRSKKNLHCFDTFEGMPEVLNNLDLHKEGDFGDTSITSVISLLSDFRNVYVNKGRFPDQTSHFIKNTMFSFVHLDCDIHDSIKESLEFFYPRMVKDGIITLDDYNEPNCPGAKKAVDDFMKGKKEKLDWFCQSQVSFKKI